MSKGVTFHIRWRGRVSGPFPWPELERQLDAHEIGLLHDVQFNNAWMTLGELLAQRGEVVRINAAHSIAGPPTGADLKASFAPHQPASPSANLQQRRIFVALAVAAGFSGVHNFYAQHWIRGALLLGIALLLWHLQWGIVWPWLWALGEAFRTKVDGRGRPMPWKKER